MSNTTVPQDTIALALLPPSIAREIQVSSYFFSGAAAVLIWDILFNIRAEYKLLFKSNGLPSLPTVVYFVSRICSLVYVLGYAIFETYPVGGCKVANIILDSFYPVAVPATSLLFFFRVRAIYSGRKYITAAFAFLWVGVLATCMTVPFGGGAINIGNTRYCLTSRLTAYTGSAGIGPAVHDSAVFFAISYRLMSNTHVEFSFKERVKSFISGAYLPAFSKALFHDGQLYYMVTVISNLLTTIMVYAPGVNPVYRSMFSIPNVMLTNVMACYVYRNTKLGYMREPATLVSNLSGNSDRTAAAPGSIPLPLSRGHQGLLDSRVGSEHTLGNKRGVCIEMTTVSDTEHDYSLSKEGRLQNGDSSV